MMIELYSSSFFDKQTLEKVFHLIIFNFFFSSRRRHTRSLCDWSSDVCSSDLFFYCQRPLVRMVNGGAFCLYRTSASASRLPEPLQPAVVSRVIPESDFAARPCGSRPAAGTERLIGALRTAC